MSVEIVPITETRPDLTERNFVYNSYSGTDITAMILVPNEASPLVLGDLQTLSYSIHRESKPVRLLGHVNPLGFVNGPRCQGPLSKVLIKDRGYIFIKDVEPGDYVQSTGFDYNKVVAVTQDGFKQCYKLKLVGGTETTASYDHPIHTSKGWVEMKDLKEGDLVTVAGYAPSPEEEFDISDEELIMIAYLIGDGSIRRYKRRSSLSKPMHKISLSIANTEMDTIGMSSETALAEINTSFSDSSREGSVSRQINICTRDNNRGIREYNLLHEKLLEYNLYDTYSHNKFIPQQLIVGLNKRQIALFLSHLFSTDGCYVVEKDTGRIKVNYSSTSEELIDEIRLMLLKLGVSSDKNLDKKIGQVGGRANIISRHDSFKLIIDSKLDILKFRNRIGIFGKNDKLDNKINYFRYEFKDFLNVKSKDFLIKAQSAMRANGLNPSDYKSSCNIYNYNLPGIGPARAKRIANIIGDQDFTNYVENLINDKIDSDDSFKFKKVKSKIKLTELPVYDLEVEDRHSFICDFIKVHNTIAGSMIFINFEIYTFYRLEQYRKLLNTVPGNFAPAMYPLADMLPPFDVVITASNEYGSFSKMKISGVQIVDEGGTMSIEDLVTESQYTFMARSLEPWTPFSPPGIFEKGTVPILSPFEAPRR